MLFARWFEKIEATLKADHQGWGLTGRYENKTGKLASHSAMIAEGLSQDGFSMIPGRNYANINLPRCIPDGHLTHPDLPNTSLWYELKSVFIPHYESVQDWHNDDYSRLLRIGHPNGAIGDVDRLRRVPNDERVFLLLALSWCPEEDIAALGEFQRHREVLIDAFRSLARLPVPTAEFSVTGTEKPWSCRAMAWRF